MYPAKALENRKFFFFFLPQFQQKYLFRIAGADTYNLTSYAVYFLRPCYVIISDVQTHDPEYFKILKLLYSSY